MTFIGRLFTITALALGLSVAVHGGASAQPADKPADPAPPTPEQLEAAKNAFIEGKTLFDAKKFDLAVEKFKESYRLSRNPLLLYNVAFTFDQLGQKDMAHFYYSKFLADAPADAAQRPDATARLKVLDKELARDTTPPPGDTTTPPPGDTTTPPDGGGRKPRKPPSAYTAEDFQHQIVEEAPPGRPLDLTAFVPEDAGWQVTMFYRGGGDAKFTSVPMKPRYSELVGRIPAAVLAGSSVQYYLEVRNPAGEMITRVGRPASPNIVYIDPKAKPRYYPDLTDERDWVDPGGGGSSNNSGGGSSGGGSSYVPGGYFEAGSTKFKRAKWVATGLAVAGLGTSLTFYMLASNMSATLESEAALSNSTSRCDGQPKPCRSFNADRQAIELAGKRNELVSNITFGVGIAFTGVAAYFWYKDISAGPRAEKTATTGLDSLIAAPVAGSDYLGGTAAVRF